MHGLPTARAPRRVRSPGKRRSRQPRAGPDRQTKTRGAQRGENAMVIRGLDIRLTARYGLAILPIVLGIAMLVHGWSKLSGGVDNVAGFFGGMLGIPAPGLMAWVVTIVELVGGILLVVGFLTQIAGILIAL